MQIGHYITWNLTVLFYHWILIAQKERQIRKLNVRNWASESFSSPIVLKKDQVDLGKLLLEIQVAEVSSGNNS